MTAEFIGTALLLATVVGSGIMGERLAGGNVGLALLTNTIATGAALVAIILAFGPISGAHLNPAVTLANASQGGLPRRDVAPYVLAQIAGALLGVLSAHAMFREPAFAWSQHAREGVAQMFSEFVATFGLLAVIWGTVRSRATAVPIAVGAYITAAYWFTASTSFANPAVTLARSLTNTFSGIRAADVPAFIIAQFAGAQQPHCCSDGSFPRCQRPPIASSFHMTRSRPMRIGIFSDIHGNLPALEAVLTDLAQQELDAVYCLGDLVGYGASPNEVTDRIRAEGMPTIMGNYDDGVGYERDECGCAYRDPVDKKLGDQSLAWTKAHVTAENKAFLRTLLPELRVEADGKRVLLVHGSPRKMNEYLFEDRALSSFQRIASSSNADIIAFGHTHKPYVKEVDGVMFLNVGSVGKPKDLDWRACYAILDARVASFRRVAYDVKNAADAIRATGLPHEFAADIETGGAQRAVRAQ